MEKANPDSMLPDEPTVFVLPPLPADPGRAEALPLIKLVRGRIEAWRDDAAMRLERCAPGQEPQQRNLRENYSYLAELLLQAELALGRAD